MRIALINENSQKKKNNEIYRLLKNIGMKYNHEIFNYGVSEEKDLELDYIDVGLLAAILLNSSAVDFVITGCKTGQGAMISCNKMPNVICGYITNYSDMLLYAKINAGNAISIPFGKFNNIGSLYELEQIFKALCTTKFKEGYPKERKEIQEEHRIKLLDLEKESTNPLIDILDTIDPKKLRSMLHNDYFEENFFERSENDILNRYLLNIIDERNI